MVINWLRLLDVFAFNALVSSDLFRVVRCSGVRVLFAVLLLVQKVVIFGVFLLLHLLLLDVDLATWSASVVITLVVLHVSIGTVIVFRR